MDDVRRLAYRQLVLRVIVMRAAVLFLAARSLSFWQAWLFLGVDLVGQFATTWYLVAKDPELLRRRINTDPRAELNSGRRQVNLAMRLAVLGLLVTAGLDHRDGWSHVPPRLCIVGDVILAAGLALIWLTFRANSFAASIVEVDAGQHVVSSGPYALIRHPMYTGLILNMTGTALALGSWWALTGAGAFAAGVVVRLLEEEQFLARSLAGYAEYRGRVRHRLAPMVW